MNEWMLLFKLILVHLTVDFILYPDKWNEDKSEKHFRSPYLYAHALLYAVLAYLVSGQWLSFHIPLVMGISHLLVNLGKSYAGKDSVRAFIVGQALNLSVIGYLWVDTTGTTSFLKDRITDINESTLIIVIAYIIVLWPLSTFINLATKNWSEQLNREKSSGLLDAGNWIGKLERVLILTFILIGEYNALGFLLAAKAVFRFNQLQNDEDRKKTEYVLIGTLLSFTLTILLGIGIEALI